MEDLITEIGIAIVLMAIVSIIGGRLGISIIPLLVLAGLAVGPHAPQLGPLDLRFIESEPLILFLGRVGTLFLLFYIGLEFSLSRLLTTRRTVAVAGITFVTVHVSLGVLLGWVAGLSLRETLLIAGIMAVSSSATVAKTIVDLRRTASPESGLILGAIMTDDILVALYIAIISGFVFGEAASLGETLISTLVSVAFVVALLALGRYLAQYLNRWLSRFSEEAYLLTIFALIFLVAAVAEQVGLAQAVGALLLGLILGETEHTVQIQRLVASFRDFFGAFLFFSFGLSVDPTQLGESAWLAGAAAATTLFGSLLAAGIVARMDRLPALAGLRTGLIMISRGEISIIIASLAGTAGGLAVIEPFTAVYVLILSISGPLLARESDRIYGAGVRARRFAASHWVRLRGRK